MFANKEVATRHLPIARGPEARGSKGEKSARDRLHESRRSSETRLQAAFVDKRKRDDAADPYADVPCTD